MGQKQSSTANWTMNDWAFGTAENAVQLDEVVDEAGKIPGKLFGAKAIENDQSMHQMQQDLLSFDEKLKKLFFWRKKNKRSKYQESDYQDEDVEYYYDENQQYYEQDQSHHPIPEEEEDEHQLAPIYANVDHQITAKNTSRTWICKYCNTENRPTELECRQCKQTSTTF